MTYNLSNLTTVAHVDVAIANAENRKSEYGFRKSQFERQLDNADEISDELPQMLSEIGFLLEGANEKLASIAPGDGRDFWVKEVDKLNKKKDALEAKANNSSANTVTDKLVLVQTMEQNVALEVELITALQTLRAQLVAAAA